MTDKEKLEKIRSEVIWYIHLRNEGLIIGSCGDFEKLLKFIDSMQGEPVSEDLEEAVDEYAPDFSNSIASKAAVDAIRDAFIEKAAQFLYDYNQKQVLKHGARATLGCGEYTINVDEFRKYMGGE